MKQSLQFFMVMFLVILIIVTMFDSTLTLNKKNHLKHRKEKKINTEVTKNTEKVSEKVLDIKEKVVNKEEKALEKSKETTVLPKPAAKLNVVKRKYPNPTDLNKMDDEVNMTAIINAFPINGTNKEIITNFVNSTEKVIVQTEYINKVENVTKSENQTATEISSHVQTINSTLKEQNITLEKNTTLPNSIKIEEQIITKNSSVDTNTTAPNATKKEENSTTLNINPQITTSNTNSTSELTYEAVEMVRELTAAGKAALVQNKE